MTPVLIYPYRTPSGLAIDRPVWEINGSPLESVDLTGLDYYASIQVSCALRIDIAELELSTSNSSSELEFVLTARSESAGLFKVLCRKGVTASEIDLSGTLPVCDVGESAKLQVDLLRSGSSTESSYRLAARHNCAVLWTQSERLRMSGVGARLSVKAMDFSSDPMRRGVLWKVELDRSDALSSVSSAAQVLLNTQPPELIVLLQSFEQQGLSERITRRQLQLDVARQFVLAAREFERDGEDTLLELPYDSIGSTSMRFAERVRSVGGLGTLSDLWSLYESNPADFEMILQAAYLAPALV